MKRKITLNKKAVGKAIKEARISCNATQEDVAGALDLAVSAYQQYEQGKRQPGLDTIYLICEHLNVSLDSILFAEKSKDTLKSDSRYSRLLELSLDLLPEELERQIDFAEMQINNRKKYRETK